jgi:hypothetical protein
MSNSLSIVKQLEEHYGGKWIHHPFASMWSCEKKKLTAMYMADGGYDMEGNYTPSPIIFRKLTIYGTKPHPEKFYPITKKLQL